MVLNIEKNSVINEKISLNKKISNIIKEMIENSELYKKNSSLDCILLINGIKLKNNQDIIIPTHNDAKIGQLK